MKAKKRKPAKRSKLSLFLQALTEFYNRDQLAPGIHIAFVGTADGPAFYGSLKRYHSRDPKEFEVLAQSKGATVDAVTNQLIEGWFDSIRTVVQAHRAVLRFYTPAPKTHRKAVRRGR